MPTIVWTRLPTTCQEMTPRIPSLADERPSRTRACLSTIRLKPASGLMRLASKRMARYEKTRPPETRLPATPATMTRRASGRTNVRVVTNASPVAPTS